MGHTRFVGRIGQVCDQWIYTACLCFALDMDEQRKSGFRYSYSVYQVEYSRNLLFTRGRILEQVFQSIIDRTRTPLDIKTVKTIFGYKNRPYHKNKSGKTPKIEVVVEKPAYNLTVFKVHFGKLTVKIYSKGERVLRIEAIAHNTKDLRCGKVIQKFPDIINSLNGMLERFLGALRSVDVFFIDFGEMDKWLLPSKVGSVRVGGLDVNKPRIRAVMEAVIFLSKIPNGFTSFELAEKVQQILNRKDYQSRQASYDLKKFRGKQLIKRIGNSRRYTATQDGLRSIAGFIVLRNKVILPLLAGVQKNKGKHKPQNLYEIDFYYKRIQNEMRNIFNILKIAA